MIMRDKLFEVRIMNLARRLHHNFYTALEGKLDTIWDKVCNFLRPCAVLIILYVSFLVLFYFRYVVFFILTQNKQFFISSRLKYLNEIMC